MKTFFLFLVLIISLLLQISFFHFFSSLPVVPNFLLVLAVFWAAKKGIKASLFWIFGSLILDIFSGLPFGGIALSLFVISLFVSYLVKAVISEVDLKVLIVLVISASALYDVLLFVFTSLMKILQLSSVALDFFFIVSHKTPFSLLVNVFVFLLIYPLLQRFIEWLSFYEKHQLGKIKQF